MSDINDLKKLKEIKEFKDVNDLKKLKPIKELKRGGKSKYVQLLEGNIVKKKYDKSKAAHIKHFKHELEILNYLTLMGATEIPTVLGVDKDEYTIYMSYCGEKPKDSPEVKERLKELMLKFRNVYKLTRYELVADVLRARPTKGREDKSKLVADVLRAQPTTKELAEPTPKRLAQPTKGREDKSKLVDDKKVVVDTVGLHNVCENNNQLFLIDFGSDMWTLPDSYN